MRRSHASSNSSSLASLVRRELAKDIDITAFADTKPSVHIVRIQASIDSFLDLDELESASLPPFFATSPPLARSDPREPLGRRPEYTKGEGQFGFRPLPSVQYDVNTASNGIVTRTVKGRRSSGQRESAIERRKRMEAYRWAAYYGGGDYEWAHPSHYLGWYGEHPVCPTFGQLVDEIEGHGRGEGGRGGSGLKRMPRGEACIREKFDREEREKVVRAYEQKSLVLDRGGEWVWQHASTPAKVDGVDTTEEDNSDVDGSSSSAISFASRTSGYAARRALRRAQRERERKLKSHGAPSSSPNQLSIDVDVDDSDVDISESISTLDSYLPSGTDDSFLLTTPEHSSTEIKVDIVADAHAHAHAHDRAVESVDTSTDGRDLEVTLSKAEDEGQDQGGSEGRDEHEVCHDARETPAEPKTLRELWDSFNGYVRETMRVKAIVDADRARRGLLPNDQDGGYGQGAQFWVRQNFVTGGTRYVVREQNEEGEWVEVDVMPDGTYGEARKTEGIV